MRRPAQRFGFLVLALALVPVQFSTADAGVIPWLYDAVFGPVHYGYGGYGHSSYGYGNYGTAYRYSYAGPQVSYAMPTAPIYYGQSNCGPTGCSSAGCATPSYSVGYRSVFAPPTYCSTGSCSTVLSAYRYSAGNCGTCSTAASANSTCAAKTAWKSESKEATTQWPTEVIKGEAPVPTPAAKDDAPMPKPTFAAEPADPSNGQPVAVEKVVTEKSGGTTGGGKSASGDPNWTGTGKPTAAVTEELPAATDAVNAGFGEPIRGEEEDVNKIFTAPVQGAEEPANGEAAPTTTPVLPEGLDGLPDTAAPEDSLDKALPLNLDQQSSWKFDVPVQRVAFRAGFGRATLARTTVNVDVDYVVPAASTLRLVSR
tara:strand:- start:140325 stop:141434 length:1110 start_codon:yes stop_codon:yes gene_type:complete